jgi:hypothetical protein
MAECYNLSTQIKKVCKNNVSGSSGKLFLGNYDDVESVIVTGDIATSITMVSGTTFNEIVVPAGACSFTDSQQGSGVEARISYAPEVTINVPGLSVEARRLFKELGTSKVVAIIEGKDFENDVRRRYMVGIENGLDSVTSTATLGLGNDFIGSNIILTSEFGESLPFVELDTTFDLSAIVTPAV